MHVSLRAQSLQPGDQQFAYFLLSENFANFRGNFGEGNVCCAGLLQFGNKLIAVIGFDRLGIDLHRRTKPGVDQAHQVDLSADPGAKVRFINVILSQQRLPLLRRCGLRVKLASFGEAGIDFGIGGVHEACGVHLLAKQLLVDQAVEDGTAIVIGELGEGAIAEKSFITESLVPIGLQDDMAVDGGDNAIEYFGRCASGGYKRCHA